MAVARMMSAEGSRKGEEGAWRAGPPHLVRVVPWQAAARALTIGLGRVVVTCKPQEGWTSVAAKAAEGEGLVAVAEAEAVALVMGE